MALEGYHRPSLNLNLPILRSFYYNAMIILFVVLIVFLFDNVLLVIVIGFRFGRLAVLLVDFDFNFFGVLFSVVSGKFEFYAVSKLEYIASYKLCHTACLQRHSLCTVQHAE